MTRVYCFANPGNHPELAALAAAAARSGEAVSYSTATMWASDSYLGAYSRSTLAGAGVLRSRILPRELTNPSVIGVARSWEALYQAQTRLPWPGAGRALTARDAAFVKSTTKRFRQIRPEVLVCQHKSALELFQEAPQDAVRILNAPIAHHRWTHEYLSFEAKRNPTWRVGLQGLDVDPGLSVRMDRELDLADYVLVASSFAKRTFVEAGLEESKILVHSLGFNVQVPEAVDDSDFESGNRRLRVLFAGQVNQRKGISYFGEATRPFAMRGQIDVCAVGPVSREMRLQLGSHYPWIRLAGTASQSRLMELYAHADVVVLPSLIEGFGLMALDAMACGRTVIVSNHTFGSDVIDHGVDGFVVPARDVEALGRALGDVVEGGGLCRLVGRRAREKARAFTWDSYGDKLLSKLS